MKKIGYFGLFALCVQMILIFAPTAKAADQSQFRAGWKSSFTGVRGHKSWTSEKSALVTASIENSQVPGINNYLEERRKLWFITLPPKHIELGGITTNAFKEGDLVRYRIPDDKREFSGHVEKVYGKHIIVVDGQTVTSPWIIGKVE